MYADRQRALFGSWYEFFPRSEGATIDPETGHGGQRQLPHGARSGWTTPPTSASTSSTCRRSTRSARSTARARTTPSPPSRTTPARRGRSARRTAGTTPSTPTWGRSRTSTPSSRTRKSLGLEIALDLALQCAPDHPWVASHPEWFTTRADGTIAYAENPPKKYQDIYPVNFDNDPTGICREVLRIVKLWMSHGVRDLPRRQPAHQAGRVLGVAAARGPPDRPRRAVPGRGVHPAGDDEHPRRDRLPPVLHVLHLAHRQVGDRGLPPRAVPPAPTT